MSYVVDINKLHQYITFHLINIAVKNTIYGKRLYYIFHTQFFLLQCDTAISLCRERSLARRRALAFRMGALSLRGSRSHF